MTYLYLYIDLLALSLPFIVGFFPRFRYHKEWPYLFPGIILMMLVFISWDIWFTDIGVWGFNPDYLTGVYIFGLPLEEWLFFICIPYSSVFIYHCLGNIREGTGVTFRPLMIIISSFILLAGIIHFDKYYTASACLSCGGYLLLHIFYWKSPFLKKFMVAYLIILIPFFVVNGILTGSFIKDRIVWYNPDHFLGIRMGTIPVEDSVYGLFMLLLTVHLYEWLKSKSAKVTAG